MARHRLSLRNKRKTLKEVNLFTCVNIKKINNIYMYILHIVKARPVHMCLRSFPHLTRGFFQKPVVAAASGLEGGISLSNSAISDAERIQLWPAVGALD